MNPDANILIVEDDPLMQRMYERIFKLSGYNAVTVASNGEEAIDGLGKNPKLPDVILLDVMMPKMNGFEVLQKLKGEEKWRNIPVIMLSNLAGPEDAKKALDLGAKLFLIKSNFTPKQVVEKVKETI